MPGDGMYNVTHVESTEDTTTLGNPFRVAAVVSVSAEQTVDGQ